MSDIEMVKRRFPYWIRNPFLKVRDLKFSLGKSGRFRTSGSTFGLGAPEAVLIDFGAGRSLKYSLNGSLTKNDEIP